MRISALTWVVLLGGLAILGIIAMQSYLVISNWNINEDEFNKKVKLALHNVAKELAAINDSELPPRNVIRQRTTNYYVVNIESEIDANNLEYFLQKELESLALNVDFEYAVFDCDTDEMVYGNYFRYSPEGKKNVELGNLPKYNEFTYYFGVKFPTRTGYLFGKTKLSIIYSAILLLTILFFALALFVILRQKRLSEMQKDFINNMTHEFKTPISTIKISADVFLNNQMVKEDDRLLQYASIIKEQNQRLNSQVEKVLQLAKIDNKSLTLKKERVNITTLIENVLAGAKIRVEKLGGTLVHQNNEDSDLEILVDRVHFTNVVNNLLDNAIKYSSNAPNITVETNSEKEKVKLKITDQGIGMEKEQAAKVFDKFYRVPTGNVHNVKGFGLGLYYVKRICDAHNWRIKLLSELGKGTEIEIIIPKA